MTPPDPLTRIAKLESMMSRTTPGEWKADRGVVESAVNRWAIGDFTGLQDFKANSELVAALHNASPWLLSLARRGAEAEKDTSLLGAFERIIQYVDQQITCERSANDWYTQWLGILSAAKVSLNQIHGRLTLTPQEHADGK